MLDKIVNKLRMSSGKKGFTLAEFLVTLTVLGILASLAVPGIIQSTQEFELRVGLKKTYSDLGQVMTRLLFDRGGSLVGTFNDAYSFRALFLPYLNIVKTCDTDYTVGNCWSPTQRLLHDVYSGDPPYVPSGPRNPSLVLSSGITMYFQITDASGEEGTCGNTGACGLIGFDVNGYRGPNVLGIDKFFVWIYPNKILPMGYSEDPWSNFPETDCIRSGAQAAIAGNDGFGCTALYLR